MIQGVSLSVDATEEDLSRLAGDVLDRCNPKDGELYGFEGQMRAYRFIAAANPKRIKALLELAKFRAFSIKMQTCKHDTEQASHEAECFICGTLDCPTGCELHYHHDGCADCK